MSAETIESARRMLDRLYGALRGVEVDDSARASADVPKTLVAALEDDLNSPKAMAEVFGLAKELNKTEDVAEKQRLAAMVYASGDLIGLLQTDPETWFAGEVEGEMSTDEIEAFIEQRRQAKSDRNFEAADRIRDQLAGAGVQIEDGRDGTIWRRS